MKQFGNKIPDKKYVTRPGAHIVLFNDDGKVAAVEYYAKYFLPGGGVQDGETPVEALHREVREETGWKIRIDDQFATAGEYIYASDEDTYFNKIGNFFFGELLDSSGMGTEPDHTACWVTIDEFTANTAHESHAWALCRALETKY